MIGGLKKLFQLFTQATQGTETYTSRSYISDLESSLHSERRTTWMEAYPAHKSFGQDAYHLARIRKIELTVHAENLLLVNSFDKDFLRNPDRSPLVITKAEALDRLSEFEDMMEAKCDREPAAGNAIYKRTVPLQNPLANAAPAISLF